MKAMIWGWIGFGCLALAGSFLTGCMSYRETNTMRAPEEQMLLSKAVDYSLGGMVSVSITNRTVFVDVSNLDCPDKAYVTDAVRQRLAVQGARLVDKADAAQIVVAIRAGMLATQSGEVMIGIPAVKVPTGVTSGSVETPEVAVYKRTEQEGWSKLTVTAYDTVTKTLLETREGTARTFFERWHILFIINFNRTNVPELTQPRFGSVVQ